MSSPFRDAPAAALERVQQLEARIEALEAENEDLRKRPATADAALAKENARLRDENTALRVAVESRRRELAKTAPQTPDAAQALRAISPLVGVAVFVSAVIAVILTRVSLSLGR
jgi:hypothetical protein